MSLIPNTTYYYRVKAVTPDGESAYSETTSVTTLAGTQAYTATTVPSIPVVLYTEAFQYSATVHVAIPSSSENILNYIIEASLLSDFSTKVFTYHQKTVDTIDYYETDASRRVLTINNLDRNTIYYIRIKASNSLGSSNFCSNIVLTTNGFDGPDITGVSNLTAISARLNWLPVKNYHTSPTYTIDVATDAAFTSKVVNAQTTTDLYYDIPVLVENTNYYARVKATSSAVASSWSTVEFSTLNGSETLIELNSTLYPPIFKNPIIDTDRIQLNWYAVDTTSIYNLQISTVSNFSSTIVDEDLTALSYSVENLNSSTVYYYRIRTLGKKPSAYRSANASTLSTETLNPPLVSVVSALSTKVNLSIVTRTYSTFYAIDLSTNNSFTQFKRYYVYTDSLTIDNLTANTTYYLRIKGLNSLSASNFSSTASFNTATALPAITVNTTTRLTSSSVQLNWSTNNQYSRYLITIQGNDSVSLNSIFSNYDVGFVTNFYLDYLLVPNSIYTYQIIGVTATGDKQYSNFQSFTTPGLPAKLAFNNGLLSWSNTLTELEVSPNGLFIGCLPDWSPNPINAGYTTIPISKLVRKGSFYLRGKDSSNTASDYSNTVVLSNVVTTLEPQIGSDFITININKSKYTQYKLTIVKIVSNNPVTVANYLYPSYTSDYQFSFINLDSNSTYTINVSYLDTNEYRLLGQYTYKTYNTANAYADYTLDTNLPAPAITVNNICATALQLINSNEDLIAINLSRSSDYSSADYYKETFSNETLIEVEEDTTYYLRVSTLDVPNNKYSTVYTQTITTPRNVPALVGSLLPVTISSVSVLNANEVILTHTVTTGVLDYLIEISETNTFTLLASGLTLTRVDTNKVLVSGLLPTKVYYGRISAYNRRYKTTYSSSITIDTTP